MFRTSARILLASIFFLSAASGQYNSLSTDRYGSRVLFATPLTPRGEDRNDVSKIIEVSATGTVHTVVSIRPQYTSTTPLETVNFPALIHPDLSSDGLTTARSGRQICDPRKNCGVDERVRGTINVSDKWFDKTTTSNGNARLSANGRWGLFFNPESPHRTYWALRMELQNGSSDQLPSATVGTPIWGTAPAGRRIISNDGTFVSTTPADSPTEPPTLFVHRTGATVQTIALDRLLEAVTISDDSRFVVGQTIEPAPSLVAVELSTGSQITLVSAAEGCRTPALSEDGALLLFLSSANWEDRNPLQAVQVWTMDLLTGSLEQWTDEPSGIAEATLSGDGQIAWAATLDGRLIRVTRKQTPVELLSRTPIAEPIKGRAVLGDMNPPPFLAPGSRYELNGNGLLDARLRWQGQDVESHAASPTHLEFILPWDAALGRGIAELENPLGHFQPEQFTWELRAFVPRILQSGEFAQAAHADSTPLTPANPGRAGEVITVLLNGLGPVDSERRALAPLSVHGYYKGVATEPEALEVVEAIYDPAQPGLYKVRVRLPQRLLIPQLWITVSGIGIQDPPPTDSMAAPIPVEVTPA